MRRLIVESPLPREEAVSRMLNFFSLVGWRVDSFGDIYLAEGPRPYLALSVGLILFGVGLMATGLPGAVVGLVLSSVGVVLLTERHALAIRYSNGLWLIAASSSEAYEMALLFAGAIRGKVTFLEEARGVAARKPLSSPRLRELETMVMSRSSEHVVTALLPSEAPMSVRPVPSGAQWSAEEEASMYELYLRRLEEARARGAISARAYEALRREYVRKLEELKRDL